MKKKFNRYFLIYLLILLILSYFFLFIKHQVGNDSTISEWLINYEGGFTKRGIIGQISIELTRFFKSDLRWTIFLFQSFACTLYFFLLYHLIIKLKIERVLILSIFTPIFILYPIAEIEVLARKEILVFSLYLIYLMIPKEHFLKVISLSLFLLISILIWEPIIFFFPIIFIHEIIDRNIMKINKNFLKLSLSFFPGLIFALLIITKPLTIENHDLMASILKNEFGQECYMSCALLKSKSTIIQQFQGNYASYSLVVFIRYSLIILIGFYPLYLLIKHSYFKDKTFIFFKIFKKPFTLLMISLSPVIFLFAMGYDWGRWVNITYVILAITFFKLLERSKLKINYKNLKNEFLYKIRGKTFIIFFLIFCFGWNPKTVITGDVASFPGYRVPYKVFKILAN
tara:strand:+ start:104 stop:1300 length:1197 start_codon:yes stop_codon:yes gene_type:complete